jgi:hypothetical protein
MTTASFAPDLARSGLTAADARKMRVQALAPAATHTLTKRWSAPAYKIPYFDPSGRTLPYFRLRFLVPVEELATGKILRYWQPPKSAPHVYLPPQVDWTGVLNSKQDVMLTEGEKKAACASKILKVPCIGLGGVWSFGSKRLREPVSPDLAPFLKDRRVNLCFDTDPTPKPEVIAAEQVLVRAILRAGGDPWVVRLPLMQPDQKTGLDDFLVARGADAYEELTPERAGEDAELIRLNAEVCFIEARHAYYHLATQRLYSEPKRFAQTTYANRRVIVYGADGEPKEKNAFDEWRGWARRQAYRDLIYVPGAPKVHEGALNSWSGWGVSPKRGGVAPFQEFVRHLFIGAAPGHLDWFLSWLAYPLQHPGVKLYTSVLLYSRTEGVGKSLLGESMRKIYGDNFIAIKAEHLHSSFNGWVRHKQFILGDEVTGRDRKEDVDRLKNLITQERVVINEKYQEPYTLEDRANYLLTTNRGDALMMGGDDRRNFVHEITVDPLPDEFYTEYDAWYRSEAGAAALFYYLLNLDTGGFDPRAAAPRTAAKSEMSALASNPTEFDAQAFLAAPERILLGSPRDLYTAQELARLLDATGRTHAVTVGRALAALGLTPMPIRTARGTLRVYAVRNYLKWKRADHHARAVHYDGAAGAVAA